MTHWLTERDDMLSDEMLNEIRKNCAANGRFLMGAIMVIGLFHMQPGVVVMALLALSAGYLSDFMMLMRMAAVSSFFGLVSFVLGAVVVVSTVISLLF